MDDSNGPCFQSVVILGLKTALLEAQDEIIRIRKERDDARKKALQLIQSNSKFHVEVINSNQLATKLKTELKKVRHELEELKKEAVDKEHDNINLVFKVKELKSHLESKMDLLESLNIKGDKVNKDEFIDSRTNYKILMRGLKLVIKNQPCLPDKELLEDIENIIYKAEKGKSAHLSKYSVKKTKPDKKEINKCNEEDDDDGGEEKSRKHCEDIGLKISPSKPVSGHLKNRTNLCSETPDLNHLLNDYSTKTEDFYFANKDPSLNKNLVAAISTKICDKPVTKVVFTDMPDLQCEQPINVVSPEQKDIGTISDSDSDKTSGFCDTETEAESPGNVQFSSQSQKSPSPENHTFGMCMPDLLSSIDTEKSTCKETRSSTQSIIEPKAKYKISDSVSNLILKNDDIKPPSLDKKRSDYDDGPNVEKILEEWKSLKSTMRDRMASLKQFYDDNSVESNTCFKRPTSLLSSRREFVRKTRNNVEDEANFIPKRASRMFKRDPNSRKKINAAVDRISDNECEKKRDTLSPINDRNDDAEKLNNLTSQIGESSNNCSVAEKLEDCEKSTTENSSSLFSVTSCFEKPIESTTPSLTQFLTEPEINDVIDTKESFSETDFSASDDEVTVEKIENAVICRNPVDDTNILVDDKLTNKSENLRVEELPKVEPVAAVPHTDTLEEEIPKVEPIADVLKTDTVKQIAAEERRDDVIFKSDEHIREEPLDVVLSQKTWCSIDESLGPTVDTNDSYDIPEECLDTDLQKGGAALNTDEKSGQSSAVKNNNVADGRLGIDASEKVLPVEDEKPTSQHADLSTSKPEKNTTVLENSPEHSVSETTVDVIEPSLTKEKVSAKNSPKKRGRPKKGASPRTPERRIELKRARKASSVTSTSSSVVKSEKSSPATSRRSGLRSKTVAQTNDAKSNVKNVQPSKTIVESNAINPEPSRRSSLRSSTTAKICDTKPVVEKQQPRESIIVKPKVDNTETARRSSLRSSTTAKTRDTKPVVDEQLSSNTMKNGMERRKRKGTYGEILDWLKSNSKRLKSDHSKSPEQTEDVKLSKQLGRKRKTSLTVETSDRATQISSPRLKLKTCQNISPEFEETTTEPELKSKSRASPKNVRKKQQTNNQLSPVARRKSSRTRNEIAVDSSAKSQNGAFSSKQEPCNFVPSSLFEKLVDMSKMIQDRVSTAVESKCKIVEPTKEKIPVSEKENNMQDTSLLISNQSETPPDAALEHKSENLVKSSTKSNTNKNYTEPNEKSDVSTIAKDEFTSIVNLKQDLSKSANDEKSDVKSNEQTVDQKEEAVLNSSLELENDSEVIIKPNTNTTSKTQVPRSSDSKLESVLLSSSELQNDESIKKWNTSSGARCEETVGAKLNQEVASDPTVKVQNEKKPIRKSIFDSEDEESAVQVSSEKAKSVKNELEEERKKSNLLQLLNELLDTDSDDDAPIEVTFKKTTAAEKSPQDANKSSPTKKEEFKVEPPSTVGEPKPTKQLRNEEDVSNGSGESSRFSELDANLEMISQFENVRTPPKVKELFDSSDDENSQPDVFGIIEEMASISRSLLQRKDQLTEFSRSLSRMSTPSPEPVPLAPPVIPSLEKYQMYSPSRTSPNKKLDIKDDYDSEDETLVIAEDYAMDDKAAVGIENNRFSCHDTNYSYASPAYTESLTSSSMMANQMQTFTAVPAPKVKTENEIQSVVSNAIKFQFYKENGKVKQNDAKKSLSHFESIWEDLKSLYVRNCVNDEEEKAELMNCCSSVPHLAFFYSKKMRTTDTEKSDVSVEWDKIADIEKLIAKYLENTRKNVNQAMRDFITSANANSNTIANALMNVALKNAHRDLKELKELIKYLSNLCVDLETERKDFISGVQATLKNKIFVKDWTFDDNVAANQVCCTISMSILYTMLSQRTNNVKSVRDLLIEGLNSFKFRAHPIAFGVLNACSSIFNDASRNCLLTEIMFFSLIHHSMSRNKQLYKVDEVREMIGHHYKIRLGDKTAEDHVKKSMLLFDDDNWVDAVVLLCKRKQFPWSYTNVIMKYLIQILVRWKEHDFSETIVIKTVQALHKILLSCPMKAVNGSSKMTYNINAIVKILSDLLQISKGSRQLKETIAVTLCGISHLSFEFCSKILLKWEPPEGKISSKTLEEMNQIMHRYRTYKPNVWLQVILPKQYRGRQRNFSPRKPNGENSKQRPQHQQQRQHRQHKVHEENAARPAVEMSKKKKKKSKSKGRQNRDNREQKNVETKL